MTIVVRHLFVIIAKKQPYLIAIWEIITNFALGINDFKNNQIKLTYDETICYFTTL